MDEGFGGRAKNTHGAQYRLLREDALNDGGIATMI